MANHAYLYATDTYSPQAWETVDGPCYISRWSMPYAWLFFFCPQDIEMFTMRYMGLGDDWQVVKLAAIKENAVSTFSRRYEQLLLLTRADAAGAELIRELVDTVTMWPGTHLCIDPCEVVDDAEAAFDNFVRLTSCVDDEYTSVDQMIEAVLGRYSLPPCHSKDEFESEVVGYAFD